MIAMTIVFGDDVGAWIAELEALDVADQHTLPVASAVVGLQVVQVVVFLIPGEVVQIASGFLFGVAAGSGLSFLGILVGSSVNFGVGRLLGRPFVDSITNAEQRAKIDAVMERRGARIGFFLLFVIPGIPKDILGYVAGSAGARFRFGPFLLFSMVGRIPGIVGSATIGATAAAGNIWVSVSLLAAAVVLLVTGLVYQRRVEALLSNVVSRFRRES